MTTKSLSKTQLIAKEFVQKCQEFGFTFKVSGSVIKLFKTIPAQSPSDFSQSESQASTLLALIPQTKAGSVWGTDGGSLGGHAAMETGDFRMNMSGCSSRVLNAIDKL